MKDNLLREAIADAKQVKQLAAEAARMQLEEAFKPHLESMISSHLRSLNEDNDASSGIGGGAVTVKNPGPKMPSAATRDSSHIENPAQEVEDVMDGTTPFKARNVNEGEFGAPHGEEEVDITTPQGGEVDLTAPQGGLDLGTGPSDMGAGDPFGAPQVGGDPFGGAPQQGGDQFGGFGAGSPDELDLEAIIRELELDSQGDMGLEEPQLSGGPTGAPQAPQVPKVESFQDPMAGASVTGPQDGSTKVNETLSGDGEEGVSRDGKKLASVDGVPGGKKVTPGQVVTASKADRMSESDEIDLDEILREIEEDNGYTVAEATKISEENTALKSSLREHREVVIYLKNKLSEVNVLNAKLLYTNKLFKNFDLRLEQKKNIVESFDRAQSVREVKIVYTTLAETYRGKSSSKSTSVKNITEGMASKAVGSTAPKSVQPSQQILEEGNAQVARMQKLAGIIKK